MKTRAYAAIKPGGPLEPFEFERRPVGSNDIALRIDYAGICHSDIHQVKEEWGPALFPMVPGHEIAGTVLEVGSNVTRFSSGDRIGVGVFIDSCRNCRNCKAGLQQYCSEGMTGTYNALERDGKTVAYGGYSNYFVINEDYAVKIPNNLELAGVAPLLCAGITLYSPLRHWQVKTGARVAVMGLGGLGHMGVKFASAMGAEVSVLSHSPDKEEDARRMGARHFVHTKGEWNSNLKKSFDLVLNTVSADIDLDPYIQLLDTDGTLVVIGLPGKPYFVNAGSLLNGRRALAGSMIGGIPELQEMLDFCGEKGIVADVEIIQPSLINEAYQRTIASDVKYRFVIDAKHF